MSESRPDPAPPSAPDATPRAVADPGDHPADGNQPVPTEAVDARSERSETGATSTWTRRVALDLDAPHEGDERGAGARRGAQRLGSAVRSAGVEWSRGIASATARLGASMDAPSASDVGGLLSDADLPALEGEPLEGLLRRLDREADLWRQLSLRALSRAGWADRVGQLASVGAWLVCATSAVLAALRGLVGAERPLSAIAQSTVSLAVVLLATAVVAWVGASVRRTQGALARAAIERADLAELRLQRLAVLLALRREDPAAFQRALLRLEGDARVAR